MSRNKFFLWHDPTITSRDCTLMDCGGLGRSRFCDISTEERKAVKKYFKGKLQQVVVHVIVSIQRVRIFDHTEING